MTTSQSTNLVLQDEVKRGSHVVEPKAPPACGGEAPARGPEVFTTELEPISVNKAEIVQLSRPTPHIAVLTLNRPQVRHAVSAAMTQALSRLVRQVEADPQVRVAILTGSGDQAFCAGADLKEIASQGLGERSTPEGGFAGFVRLPRRKFWIAAVNGSAVAGGFELMLACDMAVAVETARFGLPEVRRGLVAAAGGVWRLPRLIPRGVALELIATGAMLDASRAHALGLVNQVVPPGQALSAALAIAEQVAANAPLALAESLAIARDALDVSEETLWRRSHEAAQRTATSEDAREGPRAFAEHRAPRWTGR